MRDELLYLCERYRTVVLVGATGCGKSSCMGLLQRLYEPTRGEILLDGVPLRDYDVHFLRSRVVIVDQSTVLFNATVRENVAYGLDDVSDEEVIRALKDARAWDFVRERPDQLMSVIADGGKNLSGGPNDRPTWGAGMLEAWEFVEANVTPGDCWGPQGTVVFYHSRLGREWHFLPPVLALC